MDMKTRRTFLKRCKYPIKLENLHVGCVVTVYSRQMRVISYGDEFTRKQFADHSENTLVLVKPDGEKILGKILSKIIGSGLKITKLSSVHMNQEQAKKFYQEYENDALYYRMVEFLISGNLFVMEVVGHGSIEKVQKECELLRSKYGTSEVQDVLHCSENTESALQEIDFFFTQEDGKCKYPATARFTNTTLCLIKPHILLEADRTINAGNIIQHILDGGFFIEAVELVQLDKTNASDFLEVYKGVVQEYQSMVDEYSSGDSICMEISHSRCKKPGEIVEAFRKFCGPVDPQVAKVLRKDTIRSIYGRNKVQNAVHATDLEEDGYLEVEFFFKILRMK